LWRGDAAERERASEESLCGIGGGGHGKRCHVPRAVNGARWKCRVQAPETTTRAAALCENPFLFSLAFFSYFSQSAVKNFATIGIDPAVLYLLHT